MEEEIDRPHEINFESFSSLEPGGRPFPYPEGASRPPGLRVNMSRTAYEKVVSVIKEEDSCEVCGILAGLPYRDEKGYYTEVSEAIEGKFADNRVKTVTFTHKTWQYINRQMDQNHPDKLIVGWFHSHPGYGAYLSEDDIFVCRHYFSAIWQVAFVVDPTRDEKKIFYRGKEDKLMAETAIWIDGAPVDLASERSDVSGYHEDAFISIGTDPASGRNRILTVFLVQMFLFFAFILFMIAYLLVEV